MNHDEIDWDAEDEPYTPGKWWLRTIRLYVWHKFAPSREKYIVHAESILGRFYCKAAQRYEFLLRDIRRSPWAKRGAECGVDTWLDDRQIEPVIKHGRMHVGPNGRLV